MKKPAKAKRKKVVKGAPKESPPAVLQVPEVVNIQNLPFEKQLAVVMHPLPLPIETLKPEEKK